MSDGATIIIGLVIFLSVVITCVYAGQCFEEFHLKHCIKAKTAGITLDECQQKGNKP